jgi:hypothetical protein
MRNQLPFYPATRIGAPPVSDSSILALEPVARACLRAKPKHM